MSEWFKEHDWKSCVRLKRTGGSNPLLCANETHPFGVRFFVGAEKRLRKGSRCSEVRARREEVKRKVTSVCPTERRCFANVVGNMLLSLRANETHPLGCVFLLFPLSLSPLQANPRLRETHARTFSQPPLTKP